MALTEGEDASRMPVQGVTVTWQGHPVWTNCRSSDLMGLHHLAQRALLPAAGIGRKVCFLQHSMVQSFAAAATVWLGCGA